MCGECEEKETFDIVINVRPCTITRQGHSVSCESCKKFMGSKVVEFVVCSKINVHAKLTQICAQGIFKFCQN